MLCWSRCQGVVVGGVSRNCHWLCQRTLAGAVREDWNPDPQELALDAVNTVAVDPAGGGQREIDIKKYIKIEKIPGGSVEDCRVLKGVMFNKASTFMITIISVLLLPAVLSAVGVVLLAKVQVPWTSS